MEEFSFETCFAALKVLCGSSKCYVTWYCYVTLEILMTLNVSLQMGILEFMKGVFLVNFNLYGDQGGGTAVEYFVNVRSL